MNRICLGGRGMNPMRADENYIEIKSRFIAEGRRFTIVSVQSALDFEQRIVVDLPYSEGRLIIDEHGAMFGTTQNEDLDKKICEHALMYIAANKSDSILIKIPASDEASTRSARAFWSVNVSFEVMGPPPTLIIIGTNSVGHAITHAASGLDFKIILVDGAAHTVEKTEDTAPETSFSAADREILEKDIIRSLDFIEFNEASYIVVVHPLQYIRAIEYCLGRPHAYCGVLGSRSKIEELWGNLLNKGLSADQLRKIHAPMGFDIGARTPQEIAISTLAEIIAVKNGKTGG